MYKDTNMAISGNNTTKGQIQLPGMEQVCGLPPYPIDMSKLLTLWQFTLDDAGVPFQVHPAGYHPTIIGQYALANWNQYLATNDDYYRNVFLTQANWLVQHEAHICNGAGGWPISSPHPDVPTKGSWLSALAQGNAISVLMRAFQLTAEAEFLEAAHRAVQTFKQDILDGGIRTPIGEDGIFFEEIAIYPARHSLSGFIFALCGLYDYTALTEDAQMKAIIERSLLTLHILLDEFDTGFWTRVNLLNRRLSSHSQLSLHAELISTLASYSGCEHCLELSFRWKQYQHHFMSRMQYFIADRCTYYNHVFQKLIRKIFFSKAPIPHPRLSVCIPITGFPLIGGTRAFLAGLAEVTSEIWQIEYLTQQIGPNPDGLIIHKFGWSKMSPWQFPLIWFYFLAGLCKLLSLLRQGAYYQVILPQDGVFTAAFAALAAKLAGVHVVCIDHGNLVSFQSQIYRTERIQSLSIKKPWFRRPVERLMFIWYWPSLFILTHISARYVDQFLIPGVVGDGTEEICRNLGIPTSRIVRFGSMIDTSRYTPLEMVDRTRMREKHGIATEAIVVAIICRLAPEKGLDIGLEAIDRMISELSLEKRSQVHIIIAGDGPLRADIEKMIHIRGLSQNCVLWGETSTTGVISLLGMSDIFLYTSRRGACLSMAVLEAMASGCAVVASIRPLSNVQLLADGRGIAVPAENVEETSIALKKLVNDLELCRSMGRKAREYVARQHSPAMLKRVLMRATYWSELDGFLKPDAESKG